MQEKPNPYRPDFPPEIPASQAESPETDAEGKIRQQVIVTTDDYVRALKLFRPARRAQPLIAVAIATATMLFVLQMTRQSWRSMSGFLLLGALMLIAAATSHFWTPLVVKNRLRRQLEKMGRDKEEVLYEFGPGELRLVTTQQDTRLRWQSFTKWRESENMIVAFRDDWNFQLFPIDRFSPQATTALRAFLDPLKKVD